MRFISFVITLALCFTTLSPASAAPFWTHWQDSPPDLDTLLNGIEDSQSEMATDVRLANQLKGTKYASTASEFITQYDSAASAINTLLDQLAGDIKKNSLNTPVFLVRREKVLNSVSALKPLAKQVVLVTFEQPTPQTKAEVAQSSFLQKISAMRTSSYASNPALKTSVQSELLTMRGPHDQLSQSQLQFNIGWLTVAAATLTAIIDGATGIMKVFNKLAGAVAKLHPVDRNAFANDVLAAKWKQSDAIGAKDTEPKEKSPSPSASAPIDKAPSPIATTKPS